MAIVRAATEGDVPRILELYQQLALTSREAEEQAGSSLDDYRRVFGEISGFPGYELLVAEDAEEVIGSLELVIVPNLSHGGLPWAVIENVVVDRKHRRSGVGRQLMEYAVRRAREKNCCRVGLSSDKSRHEAHQFYRDMGFEASAHGFRMYF